MKIFVPLSLAVLQAGALLASLSTPAAAASVKTEAFLAHVIPDVDFLDRSSRMALDHTKNARLHTFAFSEATEQTLVANQVDDWIDATKGVAVASVPSNSDQVVTGRSVAVDQPVATPTSASAPPAVGQEDVDHIDGMADREFEDFYKAKQADALAQLSAAYQDYSANGDDPVLQAMAKRELPKVTRRLIELRRL